MSSSKKPIILATRGSALALAQTNTVLARCRAAFPELKFEAKIIKTTGDKLQTAPPDLPGMAGTKGLFTKELENALLNREADFAVHSLKDLPTDLPEGLQLSAVLPRADVRDVLIYRGSSNVAEQQMAHGFPTHGRLSDLPSGATIATSSTRRQAQVLAARSDFKVVPIRGNVGTRLQKLADSAELHGLILAAAGLLRLGFEVRPNGQLAVAPSAAPGTKVPAGLLAAFLSLDEMLPCVGQGAIGIEGRVNDTRLGTIFWLLNDEPTWHAITAERAFLHGMGGGCLSPVAAHAQVDGDELRLRAVSFRQEPARRMERTGPVAEAAELGARIADELKN